MTEQAGTPEVTPAGEKPDDSKVEVSAQFKDEALRVWKPAAEKVNQLEKELQERDERLKRLEQLAYGGGAKATDPSAEAYAQAVQQAEFDPVARLTVENTKKAMVAQAEAWLGNELLSVPESKRKQVAGLIRNAGYQMGAQDALNLVTDPETKTLAEQLAELKKENDRLKNAKPNGTSPSAAMPASASADDGKVQDSIKMSEYVAILQAGGDRARELKQAVGSNKTKLIRE